MAERALILSQTLGMQGFVHERDRDRIPEHQASNDDRLRWIFDNLELWEVRMRGGAADERGSVEMVSPVDTGEESLLDDSDAGARMERVSEEPQFELPEAIQRLLDENMEQCSRELVQAVQHTQQTHYARLRNRLAPLCAGHPSS